MVQRIIHNKSTDSDTKTKILHTATELFALQGYHGVSMKDIAHKVRIKAASIYYYYESKEVLMAEIISRFEAGYRNYMEWLSAMNNKSTTLDEFMDTLFNDEMLTMQDPIGCLGISLMLKNQHINDPASRCVVDLIYGMSIKILQANFDSLVENKIIPPNDTKTLATILISCILVGNEMRMYEYEGKNPPLRCTELFSSLKKMLRGVLATGL